MWDEGKHSYGNIIHRPLALVALAPTPPSTDSPSLRHVQARFPLDRPSPLPFPRIQRLLHHSGTRNRRKRRPINTTHVSTFRLDPESSRKHQTRRLDLVLGVAMNTGTSTAKITGNVNTASNNPRTVSQEDQKREISRWARRGRN